MNSTRVFQRHKIYMIIDACFFWIFLYYWFAVDSWSIPKAQSNNTRAQKWLAMEHCRVGAITQSTLRRAKHFDNTQLQCHSRIIIQGSHSGREMKTFQHQILG